MNEEEAIQCIKDHGLQIKDGVIILRGDETVEVNEAIDYLCLEWDYAAMFEREYKDANNKRSTES